jgi:carbon monoxide dehydrogenase subunit G
MAQTIEVSVLIPAPPDVVWADVEQVERHVEWMADAESIEFLGDQQRGVGTRMRVATKVGPLRTMDIMEFTGWEPPHTMAIRHQGLVTGEGAFTLAPEGAGTRFTWREQLTFPWYLGGPVTAFFAGPVLKWIWVRNLRGLAARFADA